MGSREELTIRFLEEASAVALPVSVGQKETPLERKL